MKPDDPAVLLMSGGTTGTPKGVLGKHGAYVIAGLQEVAWMRSVLRSGHGRDLAAAAALPCLRARRSAGAGVRQSESAGHRPQPARPLRPASDDPPGEARVLQRRADAVHRAPQPSRGAARKGRLQVHQDLYLGRRAAHGRHEEPVRVDDRRAHHRRVFADRSDDGRVHQPGERPEQARLGRHAAARRARPHLRRRRRHTRDAGRRNRRDRDVGSAVDDRLLEPPG